MKERRKIVDTTLRDGEQSPGIALRTKEKIQIAALLDEIGIYEIEAAIPALGQIESDCIQEIMKLKKKSKISVWCRMNPEDVQQAILCKPDIIHIGAPVSYVQIYKKLNKNKTWVLKTLLEVVNMVQEAGIQVTVGFEDASRADMGFLTNLAGQLKMHEVKVIRLADTVGVFHPVRAGELVETMLEHCDIELEVHMHNDLGMAVANSIEGAKAGAQYIDCTLFGLGERSGNCNLYDFVHASSSLFDCGIALTDIKNVEKQTASYFFRNKRGKRNP